MREGSGSMEGEDEREIRRLLAAQTDAWNRGDAEGFASTSESDLGFTNIRGGRWIGRDAAVATHKRIFEGIYAGSTLTAEIERIAFLGTDVALVEQLLVVTGARAMPPGIVADADGALRTRMLELFERRDGGWTMVVMHNTPVLE